MCLLQDLIIDPNGLGAPGSDGSKAEESEEVSRTHLRSRIPQLCRTKPERGLSAGAIAAVTTNSVLVPN